MFTLTKGVLIAEFTQNQSNEMINFVREIAKSYIGEKYKNLKTVEDCFYFINQSSDYDLFLDSEVEAFLSKYGVEVTGNEPKGFFSLMQKINRPTQWKNKIYYICDSSDFNETENDIYRSLAFYIKINLGN